MGIAVISIAKFLAVALALGMAAVVSASPMDEESKQIFTNLTRLHAASVVRVSFVMTSRFQGQEQSQEASTTGVIVDARGLVLVSRMVVSPTVPGMEKLTNEQRAGFKFETGSFRVHFPGVDTPAEAEALTSDDDQGVAWLHITTPDPGQLKPLDLAVIDDAAPGQAYYVIERLDKKFGEAPILSWGVIVGTISVPQVAFMVTGAAGLALSAEGKVIGYVAMDLGDSGDEPASMSSTSRQIMTPARKLKAATERAASLLEEPPDQS